MQGPSTCHDSYRTLLGVFSNIGRHPAEVVEEAAAEALSVNAYSARAFKALVAQQAAADARRDVCMSTIDCKSQLKKARKRRLKKE